MRKKLLFAGIVTAAIVGAAIVIALRVRGGSDDSRLRAFFELPTPSSCDASAAAISVESSHFSAFVPGSSVSSTRGKFLIVVYSAPNDPPPDLTDHVVVVESSGDQYSPLPSSADVPAQELVFDVPTDLTAAKLIFDDGCTHQEWIAP